jgi:hypothetical protein
MHRDVVESQAKYLPQQPSQHGLVALTRSTFPRLGWSPKQVTIRMKGTFEICDTAFRDFDGVEGVERIPHVMAYAPVYLGGVQGIMQIGFDKDLRVELVYWTHHSIEGNEAREVLADRFGHSMDSVYRAGTSDCTKANFDAVLMDLTSIFGKFKVDRLPTLWVAKRGSANRRRQSLALKLGDLDYMELE